MKFENTFEVDAPIDEVWAALLDVERVAPNVPGASVNERIGDDRYKAQIKVKVGPMSMIYRGDIEVIDRDEAARRAVMRVKMKESRGQGNANATAAMHLEGDDRHTVARIETDVDLSGKVASMGRGVIQDVSAKLVRTFAHNLQAMFEAGGEAEPEPAAAASTAAAGPTPTPPAEAPGETTPAAEPAAASAPPRAAAPPPRPSDEALDLGELGGQMVLSRLRDPKALGGLLAVVALIAFLVGRRSGR